MFVTSAGAAAAVKTVRYRGYAVTVPAGWPVFHLQSGSTTCVRFNRHAVYLGQPSSSQRCPAHAAGRTEAILIAPRAPLASHGITSFTTSLASAPTAATAAQPAGGSETQLTLPSVSVTATWSRHAVLIMRALHVTKLTPVSAPRASAMVQSDARSRLSTGTVYTGKGFDACSTPSTSTMSAWSSSPYRALGVYIGGTNSACAQPNLNSTWMSTEWAAGWHVIPIYVGLQAPSNSCGCAGISSSQATSEGTAAATDAVAHAQADGIGAGNPIYDDMEAYSHTSANTSAVMNFLAAWTAQLHTDGYGSGVYSSTGSGIADLVARYGTTYTEPDDIWVADWNGQATTSDASLPSGDWPSHQRLHQYAGAHNETYGGATINIDNDYLDAATAFGGAAAPPAAPSLRVAPTTTGTVNLSASWARVGGISTWRTLGGSSPTALTAVDSSPGGSSKTISERSAFPYYAVQAVNSSGQVLGTSSTMSPHPYVAVYGRSAFVSSSGTAGVPAGCFTGATCEVTLTVHAGRQLIASTLPERLAGSGGLLFFKLNAAGRKLLARGHQVAVKVSARDVSGRSATETINLIPYLTVGRGPTLSSTAGGGLRFIGLRDFVYRSHSGGILAGCSGSSPCLATVTITAGHQTVATTGSEFIGANSTAYLAYRLTAYGAGLLATAKGNQLGAQVTQSSAAGSARGHLSLMTYR